MLEFEKARIREIKARFPSVFGLRAFPGRRFHICESASLFCGEGLVYLATESGAAFCKGTEAELRREIVSALEESRQPEES